MPHPCPHPSMFPSIAKVLVIVAVAAFAITRRQRSIRRQTKKGKLTVHRTWEDEIWTRGMNRRSSRDDAEFLPTEWDSASCLERWGLSRLETEPDPAGMFRCSNGHAAIERVPSVCKCCTSERVALPPHLDYLS